MSKLGQILSGKILDMFSNDYKILDLQKADKFYHSRNEQMNSKQTLGGFFAETLAKDKETLLFWQEHSLSLKEAHLDENYVIFDKRKLFVMSGQDLVIEILEKVKMSDLD